MPSRRSHGFGREVTGALHSLFGSVAKLIPGWVFRVKAVCVMELHREHWKLPTDISGIRWAGAGDVERLEDLSRRPPGVQARLARGGRPLIRVDGDRILGCMWFEPSAPLYEKWLQLVLADSERWISDIYVAPDHRGKGIAGRLGTFGRSQLPDDVTRVVGVATAMNAASLRAAEKSGYDITRIWYLRILGLTVAKLPTRWCVGWWRSDRPLRVPLSEIRKT